MTKYPEPVVGTFIFNPKGELLLLKVPKWQNKFVCPGGHVEWGETMEQAFIREAKEETGIGDLYDIKFLNVWDYIPDGTYQKDKHMIFINMKAKTNISIVKLNEEATEYKWATPQDALKLDLESYTRKTIEEYLV